MALLLLVYCTAIIAVTTVVHGRFVGWVRCVGDGGRVGGSYCVCLLYTSPSPRDKRQSRMPSSA